MRYLTIRIKLIILTLITLIPIIILGAVVINKNINGRTEQKLQANVQLADAVSKAFVNYIEEIWVEESVISEHIIEEKDNTKEIEEYLRNITSNEKNSIQRLSWVSPNGLIIASSRAYLIGQSVVERNYFKRIQSGEEKVLSDLVVSYVDGELVIPVARAIKKDGKLLGILVFSMAADNFISHIPNIELNEGDTLCLIDNSGNNVYNSLNNNMGFQERKISNDSPAWRALKGETVKIYKDKINPDSSYKISVDYPMKEIGWACSVSSEKSMVLKDAYKQAIQSIIILVLVLAISLIASYIFGKKITEPIIALKNKADGLREEDCSVRTDINGYDEIASTTEAFDLMVHRVEQYDKLKNQFFSNLSHEFKTPINVIYSSVQLIESFQNNLDYKDFKNKTIINVKAIRQNCYRLMKIVDNIIDITRYDAGHFKMNLYKIDIVSVIENISLSVVEYAQQKGITIIFDTEVEEKEIYCDPYMIERIVLNLISNSLKFTDADGFIYINVYDEEEKVIFSVKDTGIGMPEDKLSIIFDRFRQVDTSLNRNQEGSGLGLSIVKALVEAHEGCITVNSKVGIGTQFTIELPAAALYDDIKKIDKPLFDNYSHTIQKIDIEFSDIYSINKSYYE